MDGSVDILWARFDVCGGVRLPSRPLPVKVWKPVVHWFVMLSAGPLTLLTNRHSMPTASRLDARPADLVRIEWRIFSGTPLHQGRLAGISS